MKKEILAAAVSTAMLTSMMAAGTALAENRVEAKVTSEPIQSRTTCDKAGAFSLAFDQNTVITEGDRITIDVAYINPDNFTAICRDIDFMITPAGDGSLDPTVAFTGWNPAANIPTTASPVTHDLAGEAAIAAANGGVGFYVSAAANTQRITVDVLGADGDVTAESSITVVNNPDANITIKFLDQATNDDFTQNGIWVDADADDVYDEEATLDDNTLCIDVSQWENSTVNANMDSQGDKYTFIPSNPQIAAVVAAAQYTEVACKGAECGLVEIGSSTDTQSGLISTCDNFDNENESGYCPSTHDENKLIIARTDGGVFDLDDYTVSFKILVNGEEGANGVYFDASAPQAAGADSLDDACAAFSLGIGAATYFNAAGEELNFADLGNDGCDVPTEAKAVEITTASSDLNLNGSSNDFLYIDIPSLVYDNEEVSSGDQVSVEVTVTRAPCGELIVVDHCVGTMTDECPQDSTFTRAYYPYFTEADGEDFWEGIAVVNTGDDTGMVELTMIEADGDVAIAMIELGPYGIYANTIASMIADGLFTLVPDGDGDGVLGNARSQVWAIGENITVDGFAMIANPDSGESMGYLPRVSD